MKPGKNGLEAEGFANTRFGLGLNAKSKEKSEGRRSDGSGVNGGGSTKECVEQSAHCRTEDGGELKHAGVPGDGVLKMFFGDELRKKGSAGRHAEGANCTDQEKN